jgi:hypothetical protein
MRGLAYQLSPFKDSRGDYDIKRCPACSSPVESDWIACSRVNEIYENGIRLFHCVDVDWRNRVEPLYRKGVNDPQIRDQVSQWLAGLSVSASASVSASVSVSASTAPAGLTSPLEPQESPTPQKPQEPERPLFQDCKRVSRIHREETSKTKVDVEKIVNAITAVVDAYFGNVFSLIQLTKQLTLSFTTSDSQSVSQDKIIHISDNHYLGIKTYTKVTDYTVSLGWVSGSRHAKEFSADIFILHPLNQAAKEKADMILSKIATDMTEEILEHF